MARLGLVQALGHKLPTSWRCSLVIAVFVAQIVVNVLSTSNVGIFEGKGPKYFSDKYFTPITADGWAFSIWGLIFTGEAIYVIWQALPSQRNLDYNKDIAGWVMSTFFFQSAWLFAWPLGGFWVSILPIGLGLLSLHYVCELLAQASICYDFSWRDQLLVRLGFSMNRSWLLVANLLNFTIVLKHEGYEPTADWAVAWLIVAVLVGAYVSLTRFDVAHAGVLCWALFGIASKQKSFNPVVANWAYGSVVFTVLVFALALVLRQSSVLPVVEEDLSSSEHLPINDLMGASVVLSGYPAMTQSEQMPLSR